MRIQKLIRSLHRWGSVLIAVPLLVVIGTGILLQLKKRLGWVQPPTREAPDATRGPGVFIDPERVLEIARTVPEAEVRGWSDVDRLDMRPAKRVVKVRCKNRFEVQLDATTGEVLQVAYRRSDLIESLHDGSFFHPAAKVWIFLPAAAILAGLWLTGLYLFGLPHWARWSKRRRAAAAK